MTNYIIEVYLDIPDKYYKLGLYKSLIAHWKQQSDKHFYTDSEPAYAGTVKLDSTTCQFHSVMTRSVAEEIWAVIKSLLRAKCIDRAVIREYTDDESFYQGYINFAESIRHLNTFEAHREEYYPSKEDINYKDGTRFKDGRVIICVDRTKRNGLKYRVPTETDCLDRLVSPYTIYAPYTPFREDELIERHYE